MSSPTNYNIGLDKKFRSVASSDDHRVGFYLNADVPVHRFFTHEQTQQLLNDPVKVIVDFLLKLAQKTRHLKIFDENGNQIGSRSPVYAEGIIPGGYDGASYHLNAVDSVFVQIDQKLQGLRYLDVSALDIRRYVRSPDSQLSFEDKKLLKSVFPKIFKLGEPKPSRSHYVSDTSHLFGELPEISDGFCG